MQELKALILSEQSRFNATLAAEIDTLHPLVQPVAAHILKAGGKRLRPLLTLLVARALGYGDDDIYPLACSVELLHSATLLHDDILDAADLRRGRPAAHTVFGNTATVLAGDALLALANQIVARYGDTRLTTCISEAIIRTATGEIVEIAHMRGTDHGHDTYIDIITGKTAWMLRASCELGALRAGGSPHEVQAAAAFGLDLGIAFQIVDDALDFAACADTGKPVGGDLREGKLTPPLLFYLDTLRGAEREAFITRFREDGFDEAEVARIVSEIRTLGLVERTRDMAGTHLERAARALEALPEGTERRTLMQTLDYVQHRNR